MSSGYFLVFHGSRDGRGRLILSKLIHSIRKKLANELIITQGKYSQQPILEESQNFCNYTGEFIPSTVQPVPILNKMEIPKIGIGSLELTNISLREKIEKYAEYVQHFGYKHLKILPLFLTPGVHVCEDIPGEIAQVKNIGQEMTMELLPYLGNYPQTLAILSKQFAKHPKDGRILLAHGTRYPKGNAWLENLATQLNARIAYYSVSDSLLGQIQALISNPREKIAMIPYFLFPGRITDAITTEVNKLQEVFPETKLVLGKPLGETGELANLIVEVLTR